MASERWFNLTLTIHCLKCALPSLNLSTFSVSHIWSWFEGQVRAANDISLLSQRVLNWKDIVTLTKAVVTKYGGCDHIRLQEWGGIEGPPNSRAMTLDLLCGVEARWGLLPSARPINTIPWWANHLLFCSKEPKRCTFQRIFKVVLCSRRFNTGVYSLGTNRGSVIIFPPLIFSSDNKSEGNASFGIIRLNGLRARSASVKHTCKYCANFDIKCYLKVGLICHFKRFGNSPASIIGKEQRPPLTNSPKYTLLFLFWIFILCTQIDGQTDIKWCMFILSPECTSLGWRKGKKKLL